MVLPVLSARFVESLTRRGEIQGTKKAPSGA
ncbi:hypothetical protein RHECNPAF_64200110 [Rhizobium etli CNPAF512]|nr:hypothetical protein RHECNPAF_64200110 [Rhizobium etli CNPAF512]